MTIAMRTSAGNCATLCNIVGSSTRLGETNASVPRIVYADRLIDKSGVDDRETRIKSNL